VVEALAALAESICQGVQWVVSESPRSSCTPGARAARGSSVAPGVSVVRRWCLPCALPGSIQGGASMSRGTFGSPFRRRWSGRSSPKQPTPSFRTSPIRLAAMMA